MDINDSWLFTEYPLEPLGTTGLGVLWLLFYLFFISVQSKADTVCFLPFSYNVLLHSGADH